MHGESKLCGEEAVFDADVVAGAVVNHGEVFFTLGQFGKGGRETGAACGGIVKHGGKDVEEGRRENVHAVEAEVLTASEAGNDEPLFRFGGSGLFQHGFYAIEARLARNRLAADGTE